MTVCRELPRRRCIRGSGDDGRCYHEGGVFMVAENGSLQPETNVPICILYEQYLSVLNWLCPVPTNNNKYQISLTIVCENGGSVVG